jgi:hypothetical protein
LIESDLYSAALLKASPRSMTPKAAHVGFFLVAIVKEIFRRFANGGTLKEIASNLNGRDVPSPGRNGNARSGGAIVGGLFRRSTRSCATSSTSGA